MNFHKRPPITHTNYILRLLESDLSFLPTRNLGILFKNHFLLYHKACICSPIYYTYFPTHLKGDIFLNISLFDSFCRAYLLLMSFSEIIRYGCQYTKLNYRRKNSQFVQKYLENWEFHKLERPSSSRRKIKRWPMSHKIMQ